jgi:hypothetical protein
LIAVRVVLVTPLAFFAIAAGGIVWARRRGALTDRAMLAAIAAFVLTLGAGGLQIGAAGFNSESLVLAAALLMLAFPAFMLMVGGPGLGRIGWATAVLFVLPFAAAKISCGFVWGGLIGWWALRKLGLRKGACWLVGIADILLFGIGMWLFNPGTEGQTVWLGTPYYVELIRGGAYLSPLLINLIGFAVIALMVRAWRRPASAALGGVPARDTAEALVIAFLLANLPGTLMEIASGDAFYFVAIFGWIALPLAAGEILCQAERRAGQTGARAVAAFVLVACVVGLGLLAQRQWALVANTEALIRTGDLQYYAGKGQKAMRAKASAAVKQLGFAGLFAASPALAPAQSVVDMLHQFRAAAGNTGSLYVPPSNSAYWDLTEDCDGKSQFAMAAAGVPMLNGYYPDQKACEQEFSLLGYRGLPADLGQPLDDAGICAHAAAIHSTTVLVLNDSPSTARALSCPAQ